mgnify:CR=1 FL=1
MSKEGNPLSFSGLEDRRNRKEAQAAREAIVRSSSNEDLSRLRDYERNVLALIFPPEGKGLPLQEVGKEFGVTREAIRQVRDRAIGKLERLQRGEAGTKRRGIPRLEMDSNTRELILQNRDLSMGKFHELFGRSVPIIRRWIDEAGVPRRKMGRPRKSGISS